MSDAEVMTTALVAALFFGGNCEHARRLLASPHYVPHMLSKSRFSRRLHRLVPRFEMLFAHLAEVWKALNTASTYSIDTFPVAALDNIRIPRARLYHDEAFRGYVRKPSAAPSTASGCACSPRRPASRSRSSCYPAASATERP